MRRTSNPKALSEDELIRFYAEAEDTLGHIVFNPPQQESRIIKTENEELKQKITELQKIIRELPNNESSQTEDSESSEEQSNK
jgi:diadenosine tetraphosphate (Ap4A) HIT family hydrolase